jgi:hypothetical protein
MNDVRHDDFEIVGFNGRPLVECGRALPVVRRQSDGLYCILQVLPEGASAAWLSEDEASTYAKSGRWTKFASPILLGQTCFSESDGRLVGQPMVVYADERLLDTADRLPRPDSYHSERLYWRRLSDHDDAIQAACGSAATIEKLMDEWASGLSKRFDAMYHLRRDPVYLKRIADFALCSARSRMLRWKAYLRYASVQDPDRVQRTFETFTHREFPDVAWEVFLNEVKGLCDVLQAVPRMETPTAPPSSPATVLPKVRGIAAVSPIHLEGATL